jgi:hypothetical protein
MLEMKLAEVDGEKGLYFEKLSLIDQFLTEAAKNPEVQSNPMLVHYLSEISTILTQGKSDVNMDDN